MREMMARLSEGNEIGIEVEMAKMLASWHQFGGVWGGFVPRSSRDRFERLMI